MRDAGKPIVTVHILSGTAEEVVCNRENLRYVAEQICSGEKGCELTVTVDWENAERDSLFAGRGKFP
ncbi:hypothetical protein SDC9_204179 [bioreactor metagenome]|uniref:Uncharacterized protein n=1 Tax=bioreactor metagenome TaxID=1076179 RepID=A0A645J1A5_9ZZZZ